MPEQIKAGDVVCLKSGGPDMTVNKIEGTSALCDWFDGGGNAQHRTFPVSSLELVGTGGSAEPDDT